jgi:uracil-DNA glycosylase
MTGTAMASVTTMGELWRRWGNCTRCPLYKYRHKMVYASGPDDARVVFLGEGPGGSEDFQGMPFVGLAGQYLDKLFAFAGIRRAVVRIMNAVMCVPKHGGDDIDTPTAGEIASCRPRVQTELRLVNPRLCVLLGGSALKAIFPNAGAISDERGTIKTHEDFPGVKFFPTFHPSYLMRLPQGATGPAGLYGAHSDIVRARKDWEVIGKMVTEELAA